MLTIHGDLVTPTEVIRNGIMLIDDSGKIDDIKRQGDAPRRGVDIDASGYWVLPGFIDMHVHGGGGADFMLGTQEAARQVARTHARFGTTSMLATTITASKSSIDSAINAIRASMTSRGPDEAQIIGIHLEGPYISHEYCGAQPAAHIRDVDIDEFLQWVQLSSGCIRQITLAPELSHASELILAARKAGVLVSIGHTGATQAAVRQAIENGAGQATHLFNAMRGIHHREPGTVGAVLDSEKIIAELIVDGMHLDPCIVRLVLAAKGQDGIVLITDAMMGAAMPDGIYGTDLEVIVRTGKATHPDGTLAGSTLTMNRAFIQTMEFTGISPIVASRLTAANAARQLGIGDRIGTLDIGKQADIVILNPVTGEVLYTLVQGSVAYKS